MLANNNERHRTSRIGWLRAAVLGANDGILSTSSLVLGVAAAHATHSDVVVAGVAGLVAGAMSMAAGEYVSVHSQADTEQAELQLERTELEADDVGEHKELMAQGDETLKGTRQLWLYNPQNFSLDQAEEFSALKDLQLKVARAWAANSFSRVITFARLIAGWPS